MRALTGHWYGKPGRVAWMLLSLVLTSPAWAQCPKLLMFDGTEFRKQATDEQARYWGQTVGVQGFFVNHVMPDWQTDVGTDSDKPLWKSVRDFQSLYSRYGVTDNFIKVSLYKPHDWHSVWQNEAAVEHFAHAAALAKYAGFTGVALDLEPYKPTWGGPAGGPELANAVQEEGRQIGQAMHDAFPDMTLIVVPDVLHESSQYKTLEQKLKAGLRQLTSGKSNAPDYDRYELAVPFVRGLLSVSWKHVVVAMEQTYNKPSQGILPAVQRASQAYAGLIGTDGAWTDLSMAPGLWPLGHSYMDKSARESPELFAQKLEIVLDSASRYVWIYGNGSAWQTDGPYSAAPVDANFQQYTAVIHQRRAACEAGGSQSRSIETGERAAPAAPMDSAQAIGSSQHVAGSLAERDDAPARDDRERADQERADRGQLFLPRVTPLRLASPGNGQNEIQWPR